MLGKRFPMDEMAHNYVSKGAFFLQFLLSTALQLNRKDQVKTPN